jgi:hypothetical protein
MRNRFIDLLLEKNHQAEKKALSESLRLYEDKDYTKYDPWQDDNKEK